MATKTQAAVAQPQPMVQMGMWEALTVTVTSSLSAVATAAVTVEETIQLAQREVRMVKARQDLRMQAIEAELTIKAQNLGLPKPKF